MKPAAQLALCIVLAWAVGWFALRALDQSGRDLSLPPKPVPRAVERFLLWLPMYGAVLVGGDAHNPSAVGLWLGFLVQWTLTSTIVFLLLRTVAGRRQKRKHPDRTSGLYTGPVPSPARR